MIHKKKKKNYVGNCKSGSSNSVGMSTFHLKVQTKTSKKKRNRHFTLQAFHPNFSSIMCFTNNDIL